MGMACDCSLDTGDYDAPKVFEARIIRARKAHTCIECNAEIKPGELYERVKGLWEDGVWGSHSTCILCTRIRDEYCSGGFIYGGLREAVWECLGVDLITGEISDDTKSFFSW